MKSKLLLIAVLSALTFSLNACHKTSDATLAQRYETGALQWQLVRKEIDPNTLIHQAILENEPEVIKFLISHGVNVDYPNENGMTPLTTALVNRFTDAVEVLLNSGANANPMSKWNNMSLLEISLFMKDKTSANLLVDHGTDVTAVGTNKIGVLTKTIRVGWIDIAKKMIVKGANVHGCDAYDAPLFAAILIAARGDRTLLEMFIQKGVNLNMAIPSTHCTAYYTNTPLLAAISSKNLDVVKLLVESGADVKKSIHYSHNEDRSPLTYAIETGQPEIVQYLLQKGANGSFQCAAENIYDERHAVLLISIKANETKKEVIEPLNAFDRPKIELMLKDTIDAAFDYHTAGIEQKVRLFFLERYSQNQRTAKHVQDPYREILMIEAMEGILDEVEDLSKVLGCEKQIWFWKMAESILEVKTTGGHKKLDAFIKIKKTALLTM